MASWLEASRKHFHMCLDERVRIDLLVATARFQRVAPERDLQHRRGEQVRERVRIDRAELAPLDAAPDDGGEGLAARLDDLGDVEARDLGEIARFRDDQLRDAGNARRADALPPGLEHEAQQLEARALE